MKGGKMTSARKTAAAVPAFSAEAGRSAVRGNTFRIMILDALLGASFFLLALLPELLNELLSILLRFCRKGMEPVKS